jgi:hypothetical protein
VGPETELPGALEATNQKWNDYYKPRGPAAEMHVDICADAEVKFKRAQTFLEATLASQVRDVAADWERTRELAVQREVARLKSEPAVAVATLKLWGHGPRQLLSMWTHLQNTPTRLGHWPEEAWTEAARLLRADPACPGAAGETPYLAELDPSAG